jgi:hypothetical protein
LSLIVAEATDDGPRIVSDTRVVFPWGKRPSFKTGTLKAVVITRKLTVCFAGDVLTGLAIVREVNFQLNQGRTIEDLLSDLQQQSADSYKPVDFIVAVAGVQSQLTRISQGRIERGMQSAWIGDRDGFDRFQAERLKPQTATQAMLEQGVSQSVKTMIRLRRAMEAVIDDPRVSSVGDFCVAVAHQPDGFQHLGAVFVHLGRDIQLKSGEDLIAAIASRPVAEGSYAVSVVEPAEPGTPALGLSFPQPRLGFLYLPLQFDGAQVLKDVGPRDFAPAVLTRFGVAMKNPMLTQNGKLPISR